MMMIIMTMMIMITVGVVRPDRYLVIAGEPKCGHVQCTDLHGSVEVFLEEHKEERLHKAVHGSADKHHDEEEQNLHICQDGFEAAHRVVRLGKLQVHVNLEK